MNDVSRIFLLDLYFRARKSDRYFPPATNIFFPIFLLFLLGFLDAFFSRTPCVPSVVDERLLCTCVWWLVSSSSSSCFFVSFYFWCFTGFLGTSMNQRHRAGCFDGGTHARRAVASIITSLFFLSFFPSCFPCLSLSPFFHGQASPLFSFDFYWLLLVFRPTRWYFIFAFFFLSSCYRLPLKKCKISLGLRFFFILPH